MQKRTIYSLLLTSLLLVCAFSLASAQNTVTFQNTSVARCEASVLNVTVQNAGEISAFEIVAEITSTDGGAFFDAVTVDWDPGLGVLTHRIIDLDGVDNVSPDTIRIAGMLIDAGDACLTAGATVVAQVAFTTNDVCDGTITLGGATFTCPDNPDVVAVTQFVDCATTGLVAATVTPGVVTVVNQNPTIVALADGTVPFGDTYTGQIAGDDPDLPNGCEELSYELVSIDPPPAGSPMTVNPSTGAIFWTTVGGDVCTHSVIVAVLDECNATAVDTFEICVTNEAPELACPTDTVRLIWGEEAAGMVVGTDADGGPSPLAYSVAGFSGPGSPAIDPATGAWTWATSETNDYIGYHTLCLSVTDGANVCDPCSPSNSDECCVVIYVVPTISVAIEKTHNTIQGGYEEVSIYLDSLVDPANEMGGFDFLVQYDASALTFQAAEPGQLLVDCGWEYFTFRYGESGNCGPSACPSGILRVVAIAETNNGANHPLCYAGDAGELVKLSFLVTNDRTYECMYVPIRFVWYDCGDNGISSKSGDTLFISRHVYDYDNVTPIERLDAPFPTLFGAPAVCDTYEKTYPLRLVDFQNGGIDIVCADSIDARGDLNLNGTAYEIADAVLYSNYFVYGIGVFTYIDAQTAASDVNADGIPLSVGDLVYLTRVIVGDAQAYPKVVSPALVNLTNNRGTLAVGSDVKMGAAFMVAEGNVTPTLLAPNMEMKYAFDGVNTRILVFSMSAEGFTGEFVSVPSSLVDLQMATYDGYPVNLISIPTEFTLSQNYPNPFNPTTTIGFGLPVASDYSLTIYNVNGQEVATFSGAAEAGEHTIDWDASLNASGIYFYRLEANGFSATKKMVLVK